MTVIAHVLGRGDMEGVMVGLSDILLTSDISNQMRIELPVTQPEHRRNTSCTSIVGARQKLHLFEDKGFIMWAGSYLHARIAVSKLQKNYEKTGFIDFDWLVEQDHGYDPKQISLIVGSSTDKKYFQIDSWSTSHRKNDQMEIRSAGTGEYFFLDDARERITKFFSAGNEPDALKVNFMSLFLNGVATSFSNEILIDDFYETRYGGWYEILLFNEAIYKCPYAIKLWQRQPSGEVVESVTYSSWYSNGDLCVFSGAIEKTTGEQYAKLVLIPPITSDTTTKSLEECYDNFEPPEHTIHIMLDKASGYQISYIDGTYPQETLNKSDGNILISDCRDRVIPILIGYFEETDIN